MRWPDSLDRDRAVRAAAVAEPMIAELVGLAATLSDPDLEDALCTCVGTALSELDDAPPDDHVGPDMFAQAVLDTAATAVGTAGAGPARRVMTAVSDIVDAPVPSTAERRTPDFRSRSA